MILPIIALIFFVGFFIFYSGYQVSQNPNLIEMLANAQTGFSLFWGGVCAIAVSVAIAWNRISLREYALIIRRILVYVARKSYFNFGVGDWTCD